MILKNERLKDLSDQEAENWIDYYVTG